MATENSDDPATATTKTGRGPIKSATYFILGALCTLVLADIYAFLKNKVLQLRASDYDKIIQGVLTFDFQQRIFSSIILFYLLYIAIRMLVKERFLYKTPGRLLAIIVVVYEGAGIVLAKGIQAIMVRDSDILDLFPAYVSVIYGCFLVFCAVAGIAQCRKIILSRSKLNE